jgi:aldose 1-epimerase
MALFNLVPWSNRIANARFDFQGHTYPLRANTPHGFAIHGDVRNRPWRVTAQRVDSVTCAIDSRDFPDFNYPFPLTAEIRYALWEASFDTTLTLTNAGEQPIPAGFGFHPYFNRGFGASDRDEAQLQLKVAGVYPPLPGMAAQPVTTPALMRGRDSRGMHWLPPDMDFSALTPIGNRDIDHCFGGWDGRATMAYPSADIRLQFECDPIFGHVIIYTPPGKPFFAVEPVTHANDGFNLIAAGQLDTGVRVLRPGAQLSGTFRIRANMQ